MSLSYAELSERFAARENAGMPQIQELGRCRGLPLTSSALEPAPNQHVPA
jgi:hypothetical protein